MSEQDGSPDTPDLDDPGGADVDEAVVDIPATTLDDDDDTGGVDELSDADLAEAADDDAAQA